MHLKGISFLSLSLALCLTGCHSQKSATNTKVYKFPSFSAEAHRGGRGINPENSIVAMKGAIDLSYITTLEMDCHITKDKRVVVYHDHYLNPKFVTENNGKEIPAANKNLLIYNYTYQQLKNYDIGSKTYSDFPQQKKVKTQIALLADLIDESEKYAAQKRSKPMFYNIETKSTAGQDGKYHPAPKEFVDLMMQIISEKGIASRTVIQSFDKRTIQYLNKTYPQIKTSYLIDAKNKQTADQIIEELGFTPYIISPNYQLINKEFVADFHKKGMKVIPWTVNDAEGVKRIKNLKVDGIISDYPALLK